MCEGGGRGEGREKFRVESAFQDGSDARLLEHDLGNENRVGIGGAAPRVGFSVILEPSYEGMLKFGEMVERSA